MRKTYLVTAIISIVICIVFIINALGSSQTIILISGTKGISSYPVNSINLSESEETYYSYAGTSSQDTLILKTENGEELTASLEKREWINPQWSPESNYLSILGQESGVFDLYLYNLSKRELQKLTSYSFAGKGVSKYLWKDSNKIFFLQGDGSDKWLHRLSLNSGGEIIKVLRVPESILIGSTTFEENFSLVFKDTEKIYLATETGRVVWSLNYSSISEQVKSVGDIAIFLEDKLYLSGNLDNNKTGIYQIDLKSKESTEIYSDVTLLCKGSFGGLIASSVNNNAITFLLINSSKEETVTLQTIPNLNPVYYCSISNESSKFLFKGEEDSWYEYNNGSFMEVPELYGLTQIAIR